MRILSEEQVKRLLSPSRAIAILEAAFSRNYRDSVQMPLRTHLTLSSGAVLLMMPCHDSAISASGVKLVRVDQSRSAVADRVHAQFVLLDDVSGAISGIVEANYMTDIRTAAISAIATDILARRDAATLGIFGTGRQALAHIFVLRSVRPFSTVLVCGSTLANSQLFAADLREHWGIGAQAVDSDTCTAESHVICTCTTSQRAVLNGNRVRAGTHLNLVGSFQPQSREVDDVVISKARIFVDTYEGACAEAGDLIIPLQAGVITRKHILAELHELLTRRHPGRSDPAEITLFKSVGCAFADLAIAKLICDEAALELATQAVGQTGS